MSVGSNDLLSLKLMWEHKSKIYKYLLNFTSTFKYLFSIVKFFCTYIFMELVIFQTYIIIGNCVWLVNNKNINKKFSIVPKKTYSKYFEILSLWKMYSKIVY
jgi:hypothetical protein